MNLLIIGLAAVLVHPVSAADPLDGPGWEERASTDVLAAVMKSAPVDAGGQVETEAPSRLQVATPTDAGVSPDASDAPGTQTSQNSIMVISAVKKGRTTNNPRGFQTPSQKPSDFGRGTTYRVKPGDLLEISIWKEPDMRREMLVLPDGTISYPLAGHTKVVGLTPKDIEDMLSRRLARYFKNPFINVIVKRTTGNQIYVLGEVRNPGAFTINQPIDVMQALSLAGGLSEFADKGEIIVLRRVDGGRQEVISFKYSSVQRGRNLGSNVELVSGDTVVVPERGLF